MQCAPLPFFMTTSSSTTSSTIILHHFVTKNLKVAAFLLCQLILQCVLPPPHHPCLDFFISTNFLPKVLTAHVILSLATFSTNFIPTKVFPCHFVLSFPMGKLHPLVFDYYSE
jgi:hypothetical protein